MNNKEVNDINLDNFEPNALREVQVRHLLSWMKKHYFLNETESTLDEITKQYIKEFESFFEWEKTMK